MLNDNDLIRYSRQLIIPGFEEEGQEILISKKIVIIGAGGLGCPTALLCSAAGFGNISIWDHDNVDLSNLNRQIGHTAQNLGENKALSLVNSCKKINPEIDVIAIKKKLTKEDTLSDFDIIFDCSDNLETRYLTNKIAYNSRKILILGSATQFEGQVFVSKSGTEKNVPCYECIFPKTNELYNPNYNCRQAGIIGPVTNFISSILVTEGIRESFILDKYYKNKFFTEKSLCSDLLMYDSTIQELNKIKIFKNPSCSICS